MDEGKRPPPTNSRLRVSSSAPLLPRLDGSTILVVESHRFRSLMLGQALEEQGAEIIQVVDENALEDELRHCQFDAAVLALDVEYCACIDVMWRLHSRTPPCATVLVMNQPNEKLVREAFFVGAAACLVRPIGRRRLLNACRHALDSSRIWREAFSPPRRVPSSPRRRLPALTAREREVLEHIVRGQGNRDVAEDLHVTVRTVKYHVTNLLQKFGVTSRVELIARYMATMDDAR